MAYEIRSCEFELDFELYIQFLLQNHDKLNLPYPFGMKLSFLSSPLILGNAMLIYQEETHEIIGAAGFVYGTSANEYEDRSICQVEIAFIRNEYRRTAVFARSMQFLVNLMKAGNPEVEQVQFWTVTGHDELDKLLSRFNALPGSSQSSGDNLTFYTMPYRELETYCHKFGA